MTVWAVSVAEMAKVRPSTDSFFSMVSFLLVVMFAGWIASGFPGAAPRRLLSVTPINIAALC